MLNEEAIYFRLDSVAQQAVFRLKSKNISLIETERLEGELEGMLRSASKMVASDPNRLDEAMYNLNLLLRETEHQALALGFAGSSLKGALARLCPIFLFC